MSDLDRSVTLYEDGFGPAPKDRETTARAQIASRVDDLAAAHERAVAAGARVIHEPKVQPWGQSARYRDFDDNVIELTQQG